MNDENRLIWQRRLFVVADSVIISSLRLDASADLNPLGTKLIICFVIPLCFGFDIFDIFEKGRGGVNGLYWDRAGCGEKLPNSFEINLRRGQTNEASVSIIKQFCISVRCVEAKVVFWLK